ncbi:BamA/TamA family outer membrane protein [Shewanella sp. 4_MG-2023]|uniref:BamA/TamA family outer membrane protein n=1 Tax=Shewanella sp. 4_MG-2023 TaxID=3062652 RepID=UPI0026E14870|nr:BamA/TamA family outer membrane protein [Shewanella sp. 4_MG-2023]MDO6680026.1 BamA/TamA family outer membrane protein [Shewanella sp. 4_MG-2023]
MKIISPFVTRLLIVNCASFFAINVAIAAPLTEANAAISANAEINSQVNSTIKPETSAPITTSEGEAVLVGADQLETITDEAEDQGWFENLLTNLGADGEFDPDKGIDFSYLPGPFYNPEMSLGVGISVVGLYQVDPEDMVSDLSSLVINGLASINGALGVGIENKTFFNGDNQRLYLNANVYDIPDVYYGVGYEFNQQDLNRVEFNSQTFQVNPMFLQRISAHSFVGAGFDFTYAKATDVDVVSIDVDVDPLQEVSRNVGVNLLINYDTRDHVLNPQQGSISQFEIGVYREDFGGKHDFEVYNALYSAYYPILDDDTIAWQVRGRFTHGDVPWDQLSKIGGGNSLRGYTTGRYRDKQMLLAQVEYRQHLTGRHGMVYWVGAGSIADKVGELSFDELLPNIGIGYRLEVKPKVNLRLDLAFGDGDSGFYFNVNEAF